MRYTLVNVKLPRQRGTFGTNFGNCILWLTHNVLVVSTVISNSKHVCSTSENLKCTCIENIVPKSLMDDVTFHAQVKVGFRILSQKY